MFISSRISLAVTFHFLPQNMFDFCVICKFMEITSKQQFFLVKPSNLYKNHLLDTGGITETETTLKLKFYTYFYTLFSNFIILVFL